RRARLDNLLRAARRPRVRQAAHRTARRRRRRPPFLPLFAFNIRTLAESLERMQRAGGYSAVVGSMTVRTCEILLHGNPPRCACSRIMSSFAARYTQYSLLSVT